MFDLNGSMNSWQMNPVFDLMLMNFATDIQRRDFWEILQILTLDGSGLIARIHAGCGCGW